MFHVRGTAKYRQPLELSLQDFQKQSERLVPKIARND